MSQANPFQEIRQLSATALSRKFRAKDLSPLEVTQVLIDELDRLNKSLNMVYLPTPERALQEAKASEQRWMDGTPNGPLDGIATTIKDGLLSINEPSYRGSIANDADEYSWNQDAPVNARLREAGMVSLGKTTMPDFGILASGYSSIHGITRNPWALDKNPGGSSSGAAASVACGLSPMVVGTDIVGSIRLPASFCGLFGLKPSQGRVPYYPPNAPTLVAGPMTRTVTDAALMMNALCAPDPRDFTALAFDDCNYLEDLERAPRQLTLGLLTDIGFGPEVNTDVKHAVEQAAKAFADLGYNIELIDTPFKQGDDRCAELFYKQRCFSEFGQYSERLKKQSPYIYDWTLDAVNTPAPELYKAMNEMRAMREKVMAIFNQVDYLLLPSVAIPAFDAELPAPDINQLFAPWSNTYLFNTTEQPASSINCGYTKDGLPIGLQIVGPRFDDMGVLQLSRLYEKIRPQQQPFPAI
ncbi:amidase [Maricurvus nonylphenolicus]|uniref:amidase n=1 Tax=Maricurvus nonylphenolicus TaxID=1008307 RepID=UPI0036F3C4A7